jgi:hypothetical protein
MTSHTPFYSANLSSQRYYTIKTRTTYAVIVNVFCFTDRKRIVGSLLVVVGSNSQEYKTALCIMSSGRRGSLGI